jgi:hypothetical protein
MQLHLELDFFGLRAETSRPASRIASTTLSKIASAGA